MQDSQLVQRLIPVPVSLCPLFCHILACQVQHLLQGCVAGEHVFCLGAFPVLAVEPFYNVGGIHDPADLVRELEEGADIFPVVLPVADSVWVFLPPRFFHVFQFCRGRCLIWSIVDCLEVRDEFLEILVTDIFKGISEHVDDAPLYLCFGEYGMYGLLGPCKAFHTEEQHVLYAPVMQVIEHPQPELAGFVRTDSDTQDFLVTVCVHAQDHIGRTA